MEKREQTGVVYPTIELAGETYELRVTRGALLYRISKSGFSFADLANPNGQRRIAANIDALYAIISDRFKGTAEQLSEIVFEEGKFQECVQKVTEAVGKVFQPATAPVPAVTPAQESIQ